MKECDILIVGAGMAGSCLARQLKLAQPGLRIVVVEKKTRFDWWVGESTVEAWEDYMTRVLRLGPFLEKHFLQKHGQRFFFDSEKKDLPVERMSELGRAYYHGIAARQVDRVIFDTKMAEFNRALGIDVRLGVTVEGIDLGEPHTVGTSEGPIRCRWLIDAAGRSSPLARKLKLVEPETRHRTAAYWARFEGCVPLDDLGGQAWQARVKHTLRYNSTNHFMYRGYWIWLIAISDDVISLGVECDRSMEPLKIGSGEELERWLRGHRAVDQVLGPRARRLDFFALTGLPRCATTHFSPDRWALAGMSGLFIEVLGSGTSRLYGETNRLIGRLIESDLAGDKAKLRARAKHFNLYARSAYEATLRDLGDYRRLGSYDVFSSYYGLRVASYLNTRFPNNVHDLEPLVRTADAHGESCACAVSDPEEGFAARTRRKADELRELLDARGLYYAGNEGRFTDFADWERLPGIWDKIHDYPDEERAKEQEAVLEAQLMRRYAQRARELGVADAAPA